MRFFFATVLICKIPVSLFTRRLLYAVRSESALSLTWNEIHIPNTVLDRCLAKVLHFFSEISFLFSRKNRQPSKGQKAHQLDAPAALYLGKAPPAPIKLETWWAPESLWALCPYWESNPVSCMYSFGYFPGVRLWFADVSEHSISSIF